MFNDVIYNSNQSEARIINSDLENQDFKFSILIGLLFSLFSLVENFEIRLIRPWDYPIILILKNSQGHPEFDHVILLTLSDWLKIISFSDWLLVFLYVSKSNISKYPESLLGKIRK